MKRYVAFALGLLLSPTWLFAANPGEWIAKSVSYAKCVGFNGTSNVSTSGSGADFAHDLTCTIDAGQLKNGAVIDACALVVVTTASSAPQLMFKLKSGSAGTTPLVTQSAFSPVSSTTLNGWVCFKSLVNGVPAASVPVESSFVTYPSATSDARDSNTMTPTTNLNTAGSLLWTFVSQWLSNPGGTHTVQLKAFEVKISQ